MSDGEKAYAFSEQLESLLTKEAYASQNDYKRMVNMVERMTHGLGFAVAMASRGDPAKIDTAMAGCESYAHEVAVKQAEVIRMIRRN